jgi:hypothetical protein
MTTERCEKFIRAFIADHAKAFFPEDREELHQDIFVALLEEDPKGVYAEFQVNLTAIRVLENFRTQRHNSLRLLAPSRVESEELLPDHGVPNLDIRLDVESAIKKLPKNLQGPAEDFFYREMSQISVARKHRKSAAWASATKAKIQKLLSNSL